MVRHGQQRSSQRGPAAGSIDAQLSVDTEYAFARKGQLPGLGRPVARIQVLQQALHGSSVVSCAGREPITTSHPPAPAIMRPGSNMSSSGPGGFVDHHQADVGVVMLNQLADDS
jgi:hypothetical protein